MSGIVNSIFGPGKTSAPAVDVNRRFSTDFSRLAGGALTLDPSVRGLQEEALAGIRGLTGLGRGIGDITNRVRGGLSNLRDLVSGGRSAFIKARVDPLQETLSRRRGGLQRELGRTGVRGSFREQTLTGFETEAERALSNERARALMESLGLERQLTVDELSTIAPELAGLEFERTIPTDVARIASERGAQELAGLGLGADSINALLGRQLQRSGLEDEAKERRASALRSFISGAASAFSPVPTG